jgi:alanine racemase
MVMNPDENSFDVLVENNLEPEIFSFDLLEKFDAYLKSEALRHYPVHIEIETGMNRLGFSTGSIEELGVFLNGTASFKVQSVFSHLASAEDPMQDDYTLLQAEKFIDAANLLQNRIDYSFVKHIANSAAIVRYPQLHFDMVRPGIGLYGVDSSGTKKINLQTAATLTSTIAQIKKLKAGESVSYNRKGIVEKDSLIATVRIGYADGYPRRLGHGIGKLIVNGTPAPVIGAVCMDMVMIDITGIDGVQEGDDVIVFGKELPVQQLAQWAQTIPYEIMTGISQRVKRVYYQE